MTSRSRQKSLRQRTRVCKQGAQQSSKVCMQLYAEYDFAKVSWLVWLSSADIMRSRDSRTEKVGKQGRMIA